MDYKLTFNDYVSSLNNIQQVGFMTVYVTDINNNFISDLSTINFQINLNGKSMLTPMTDFTVSQGANFYTINFGISGATSIPLAIDYVVVQIIPNFSFNPPKGSLSNKLFIDFSETSSSTGKIALNNVTTTTSGNYQVILDNINGQTPTQTIASNEFYTSDPIIANLCNITVIENPNRTFFTGDPIPIRIITRTTNGVTANVSFPVSVYLQEVPTPTVAPKTTELEKSSF